MHGSLSCVSCHLDAETVPHIGRPTAVRCGNCHNDGRLPPERFHSQLFLGARLVPDGVAMRVVSPPPAPRGVTDASCRKCHDGKKAVEPHPIPPGTAHDGRSGVDCHTSAARPHGSKSAGDAPLAKVACGRCHVDEAGAFNVAVHGTMRGEGDTGAPTCVTCHGTHDIRGPDDPASQVHPVRVAAACLSCHADAQFLAARGMTMSIHADSYAASVHARAVPERGLAVAATCVDCHGAHRILPRKDAASASNFQRQSATCGRCHQQEAAEYNASAHGRAAARGAHEAPACSDCHGEHSILSATDPRSTTYRLAVAQTLCLGCHERLVLGVKYDLPGKVGKTYLDSYHGLATRGRSTTAAVCTDCHGVHRINAESDTTSTIHASNRRNTCGRCHSDATDRFATGPVHTSYPDHWLTNLVRIAYRLIISGTLGGMIAWITILMFPSIRLRISSSLEAGPLRFTRIESIQHLVLGLSFVALVVTGFALAFPDASWVGGLAWLGLTEEIRGIAHRIAGVTLMVAAIGHILWIALSKRGRKFLDRMRPRTSDPKSALDHGLHAVGRRPQHPHFGHFSYFEKLEYWALVWGTIVMAVTGLVLWFPEFLPRLAVNVSEAIHFYEALLAAGAILIWHMFFVLVDPDVFPLNPSIFTGRAAPGSDLASRTESDDPAETPNEAKKDEPEP